MRIVIGGDLCLADYDEAPALEAAVGAARAALGPVMDAADLRIVNLECPLTQRGRALPKTGPSLRARPEVAEVIRRMGFDVVTLANNHSMDFGREGLEDTFRACDAAGLATVGAGPDLEAASRPFCLEVRGLRLAIVNAAEAEFAEAGHDQPGANPLEPTTLYRTVSRLSREHDLVVLILHGGHEHHPWPSPQTAARFRFLAEAGAAAVIGHHTHVIAGHETWGDVPIAYSLGNFLFPRPTSQPGPWHTGAVAVLTLNPDGRRALDLMPIEQGCDLAAPIRRLEGAREVEVMAKMRKLSADLADDRVLESRFRDYCRRQTTAYLVPLLGGGRWPGAAIRRGWLRRWWWKDPHARLLLNLVRCDAHREASTRVLLGQLNRDPGDPSEAP